MLISIASHAADIEIGGGWIRATAPGQDAAGADMTITSKHEATLIGASSPVCNAVQLHTMTNENGMMKMREVKAIELPAGKRVTLRESGYHLMLIGLKAPLKEGEVVPLTLNVEVPSQGVLKIDASAEVKSLTAAKPVSEGEEHHHIQMQMK